MPKAPEIITLANADHPALGNPEIYLNYKTLLLGQFIRLP